MASLRSASDSARTAPRIRSASVADTPTEDHLIRRLAACVLVAIAAHGGGPAAALTAPARVLFRFADPRIAEASGIAVGRESPGIVYIQNDSGGGNRVYAVDARSGATAATVTVGGVPNVDWEDIAVAPDPAGRSAVWLADTGDNDAVRSQVEVYQVDEPDVRASDRGRRLDATGLRIWRLRYPDGPVDAEAFAVSPDGTGYVVTKSVTGVSAVYRLPARPDARHVQTLRRVASIRLLPTGTRNPFGLVGQLAVTGAALSPDGTVLAVRTYADAYLWRVHAGDVAAALGAMPTRIGLPAQRQGEGIAVDRSRLLVDSEGAHSAVSQVALPRALTPAPPSASSSPPGPARPTPSVGSKEAAGTGPDAAEIGAVLAAALVAILGVVIMRRRRGG